MQDRTQITLKPLWHNQIKYIAIEFDYNNDSVINYIQAYPNVKWSKTYNTFCTHYSNTKIHELFCYLRIQNWFVDYSAFKVSKAPIAIPNLKKSLTLDKFPPLISEQKQHWCQLSH